MRNRRELLMASAALAAGAGAAGLVACGDDDADGDAGETVDTDERENDVALLNALLDLERTAIAAYGAIEGGPPFGEHEREHAVALERMIAELAGVATAPKPAAEYRAGFPELRGERDELRFALDVETTSIGAYGDALGQVATASVRVTLAAILAVEAEHAAVLLGRLGRPRVPDAFVTGSPPPEAE